jgi:DNA-binding CsgD family transcriptional regulator
MLMRGGHAMVEPEATGDRGMDESEADRAAVMAVLRAETDAWLRRDFPALASHWVQSPATRKMTSFTSIGTIVTEGWEAIAAHLKSQMEHAPRRFDMATRVRWDRVNIVIGADMAWVSYEQIGTDQGDDFELAGVQHELKIFHRIDGVWKIACLVLMQRSIEHAACPLIEVDPQARVLWMNRIARDQMSDHPGLLIAASRLRARQQGHDAALRDAIGWAFERMRNLIPPTTATRFVRPVRLGDDEEGAPLFCWVLPEDGKALVSFDDAGMVARRIQTAARIYHLSPAQVRLAGAIVDGQDLATASELIGVSVNTLRTQLQRIFDKTGARSQAALVRALLSTEAPAP